MIEEVVDTSAGTVALPADTDAERAVLGTIIMDPKRWDHVADIIPSALIARAAESVNGANGPKRKYREPLFFSRQHQMIFGALVYMGERNQAITLPALAATLTKLGVLVEAGGPQYLATLEDDLFSLDHLPDLLKVLLELWQRRVFIREQGNLIADAADTSQSLAEVLERAETALAELTPGNGDSRGLRPIRADADQVFDTIQKRSRGELPDRGIDTGLPDLDRILPGLLPGNLIILAARTSMGKTALGLQIACHVALKRGRGVGFFSLEMSTEELLHRLYALESGVSLSRLRGGFRLSDGEEYELQKARDRLAAAPLFIDDGSNLSVLEVRSKARRLAARQCPNLALIIVDYLQLMNAGRRAENRQVEVAEISRALKGLAKEVGVPVLALSQLSRDVEKRGSKGQSAMPRLSDLRESGAIEQDADAVLFIHRQQNFDGPDADARCGEQATLRVAKQRNGAVGDVGLIFISQIGKFACEARGWA